MKRKTDRPSAVLSVGSVFKRIAALLKRFSDDGVTVYAAQAAFYSIIASIPFLMLLISLSRYVVPDAVDALFRAIKQIIPDRFSDLFMGIYEEITGGSGISLMSATALTALWSSSRAVASVVNGVAFIYDTDKPMGLMRNLLYSLMYTVAFMGLIIGAVGSGISVRKYVRV